MGSTIKSSLIFGECIDQMSKMDDDSIDMILVDMPYQMTALQWDYIIPLEPMWEQVKRITKKKSAIVMFSAQPLTSFLVFSNLKWFKHEWIWSKNRGTGFQVAKHRPLRSHENILVFGDGAVTYNPQMRPRDKPRHSSNKGTTRQMLVSGGKPYTGKEPLTKKYPVSVIEFPNNNQKLKVHPTQKPVSLLEYLVKTYSNPGDTVLDFTAGSFSTAIACINTSRNFIGIEIDEQYYKDGRMRVIQHAHETQIKTNAVVEVYPEWV